MTELDTLLAENQAPAPRAGLADGILAAAEAGSPANDSPSRSVRWWAASGIAAMAVMAAFLFLQPQTAVDETEAEHWEQVADNSGFADLYDWVEGEEG